MTTVKDLRNKLKELLVSLEDKNENDKIKLFMAQENGEMSKIDEINFKMIGTEESEDPYDKPSTWKQEDDMINIICDIYVVPQ